MHFYCKGHCAAVLQGSCKTDRHFDITPYNETGNIDTCIQSHDKIESPNFTVQTHPCNAVHVYHLHNTGQAKTTKTKTDDVQREFLVFQRVSIQEGN